MIIPFYPEVQTNIYQVILLDWVHMRLEELSFFKK